MPSTGDRSGGSVSSWLVWITYPILFAVGIPWYWPSGSTRLWFGMPAWVVTAIAASAAVSLLTAILLCRPWPGEDEPDEDVRQREEGTL